jgi:hypothetical protein
MPVRREGSTPRKQSRTLYCRCCNEACKEQKILNSPEFTFGLRLRAHLNKTHIVLEIAVSKFCCRKMAHLKIKSGSDPCMTTTEGSTSQNTNIPPFSCFPLLLGIRMPAATVQNSRSAPTPNNTTQNGDALVRFSVTVE